MITYFEILEKNKKIDGFLTIPWSSTWVGMAHQAGMIHLTGLMSCLGLATSPSGGHDTTWPEA
jgi:hypothetical protein